MAIKDKVVRWFIRNLLIPKREKRENPGFITEKISSRENREMFLLVLGGDTPMSLYMRKIYITGDRNGTEQIT